MLELDVAHMDPGQKAEVLREAASALVRGREALRCRIVPFIPGRRPPAEALHPGLGSSEEVADALARLPRRPGVAAPLPPEHR